jgi:hypothetical protein
MVKPRAHVFKRDTILCPNCILILEQVQSRIAALLIEEAGELPIGKMSSIALARVPDEDEEEEEEEEDEILEEGPPKKKKKKAKKKSARRSANGGLGMTFLPADRNEDEDDDL